MVPQMAMAMNDGWMSDDESNPEWLIAFDAFTTDSVLG